MDEHLLNQHVRFVTEDLDYSREVLGQAWEHHEIQVHKGWKYKVRWHQVRLRRTRRTGRATLASTPARRRA